MLIVSAVVGRAFFKNPTAWPGEASTDEANRPGFIESGPEADGRQDRSGGVGTTIAFYRYPGDT